MPVIAFLTMPGGTLEQYDAVMQEAGLEDMSVDDASGLISHVAFTDGSDLRIVDVWESAAAFNAFLSSTFRPAIARTGADIVPRVEIREIHKLVI